MANINTAGEPLADVALPHKVNEPVVSKEVGDLESCQLYEQATNRVDAVHGEAKADAAIKDGAHNPAKVEETESAGKDTIMPADSSRAKGALQQTLGSTKEAIGELLHMEGLRKAGEEQRKEGELREALAMRKDAGSGVLDAVESKLRKAVQTMKGERKSSVSDGPGERKASVSEAQGEHVPKAEEPVTQTETKLGEAKEIHVPKTSDVPDVPGASTGGINPDSHQVIGGNPIEKNVTTGDAHIAPVQGIDTAQNLHKADMTDASGEPKSVDHEAVV